MFVLFIVIVSVVNADENRIKHQAFETTTNQSKDDKSWRIKHMNTSPTMKTSLIKVRNIVEYDNQLDDEYEEEYEYIDYDYDLDTTRKWIPVTFPTPSRSTNYTKINSSEKEKATSSAKKPPKKYHSVRTAPIVTVAPKKNNTPTTQRMKILFVNWDSAANSHSSSSNQSRTSANFTTAPMVREIKPEYSLKNMIAIDKRDQGKKSQATTPRVNRILHVNSSHVGSRASENRTLSALIGSKINSTTNQPDTLNVTPIKRHTSNTTATLNHFLPKWSPETANRTNSEKISFISTRPYDNEFVAANYVSPVAKGNVFPQAVNSRSTFSKSNESSVDFDQFIGAGGRAIFFSDKFNAMMKEREQTLTVQKYVLSLLIAIVVMLSLVISSMAISSFQQAKRNTYPCWVKESKNGLDRSMHF